jgi:Protein of unknown function (DUF2009)
VTAHFVKPLMCVHAQDICAILCGLVIAQDYRRGQRMLTDRNFKDNAQFFQVGRCTSCCMLALRGVLSTTACKMCSGMVRGKAPTERCLLQSAGRLRSGAALPHHEP